MLLSAFGRKTVRKWSGPYKGKKLPTCKPDPVPRCRGGHHLSGPCITAGV